MLGFINQSAEEIEKKNFSPNSEKKDKPAIITGAAGRIRTCDHRIRNPMLYPLSHGRFSF